MSKARAKGTRCESALVGYLKEWFPYTRRLAPAGATDLGDVTLGDGSLATFECKDTAAESWSTQLDEALLEQANAGTAYGFLVRKRRGKGNPRDWYCLTTVEQMARLLVAAHRKEEP